MQNQSLNSAYHFFVLKSFFLIYSRMLLYFLSNFSLLSISNNISDNSYSYFFLFEIFWINSSFKKFLSIFIKLADGDESKIGKVKKIIDDNFDLSPRGIREMLKLNNPIYEITSAYGHFGRKPSNKGEFSWEKTDKKELFK